MSEIFVRDRGQVTQAWKKLLNKDISDLRSSRIIVRLMKYERIKSMGIVTNNGDDVNACKILWGSLKLGMQYKFNLTLRRNRATIFLQWKSNTYLHILRLCL